MIIYLTPAFSDCAVRNVVWGWLCGAQEGIEDVFDWVDTHGFVDRFRSD